MEYNEEIRKLIQEARGNIYLDFLSYHFIYDLIPDGNELKMILCKDIFSTSEDNFFSIQIRSNDEYKDWVFIISNLLSDSNTLRKKVISDLNIENIYYKTTLSNLDNILEGKQQSKLKEMFLKPITELTEDEVLLSLNNDLLEKYTTVLSNGKSIVTESDPIDYDTKLLVSSTISKENINCVYYPNTISKKDKLVLRKKLLSKRVYNMESIDKLSKSKTRKRTINL